MKTSIKILKENDLYPILLVKIRSRSDPNAFHYVKYYRDKHYECDCIFFEMKYKECYHIKKAKTIVQEYEKKQSPN